MLNFLYTQLFRLTHTTILSTGLDPYLGVLHEGRGRYAALAADMMEPFRFLVDRVLFEAVNHSRVKPADFKRCEKGPYRLLIGKQAVRILLEIYESLLAREVAALSGRSDTFRGHLYRQVMSLRHRVEGGKEPFIPFKMKW